MGGLFEEKRALRNGQLRTQKSMDWRIMLIVIPIQISDFYEIKFVLIYCP